MAKAKRIALYCIVEKGCRNQCKVGVSSDPIKRLQSLQAGNKRLLSIAWTIVDIDRASCFETEQYILVRFDGSAYGGIRGRKFLQSEWVDATPQSVRSCAVEFLEALKDG
tara:strand:+ start:76 stop:405 length:330 start_codon:yes stop_codon:yes gene_type:complete